MTINWKRILKATGVMCLLMVLSLGNPAELPVWMLAIYVPLLIGLIYILIKYVYLLPYNVVKDNKNHTNPKGLLIFNIVFGWSFVGWIICLIWAYNNKK